VRPVATAVAVLVLMLSALPLAAPLTGAAAAAPVTLPDVAPGPLSLQLTQLEPRLVTATGPQTLTVVGVLTNTGKVPVSDLEIRVQRGQPLGTEGAVRDALDGNAGTDAVQPQFVPLPGELAPGDRLPVRLAVLLRGRPDSSLALSTTGVHELLVNVNGVPQGGARARLAAVRMLLPVLSLPPDPTSPSTAGATPTAPTASPLTLLYPIADTPRRLSTVPGEPTLLTDDELATSLAPDGRLGGLVAALDTAPVGSPTRDATCLAIDPDLVETAVAMRSGYQVVGSGGAPPTPGTGAEVAGRWVDSLVAAARGGCVLALPFADADLVALNRGELGQLAVTAQTAGRQLLTDLLGTAVRDQVGWPADGLVDEPTLDRMSDAGTRAVLLSADGIEQGRTQLRAGVLPLADRPAPQFAVLTDPLLSVAASGPRQPSLVGAAAGGAVAASTAAGTSTPLSTQDAIGALAFRARSGPDRSGAPVVLAPPHQWAAEAAGATALLQAVDTLMEAGFLTPRPLGDVLAGPAATTQARTVSYPLRAGGREVVGAVTDAVRATGADIDDLRSAAVPDSGIGLSPDVVLDPLVRGLLRPMSAAFRGRPEAAIAAAALNARRIAELRGTVRVLEPPSPYALGTSDAPLLVTIGNGLPFTVQVRLEISSTSGLKVAPIDVQQVPPLGRRQARVSAQVTRSGQFTVQAAVRSPDGELLGPPSRLRVRSTAYGTITVWLTASAGVLLVVLAVRRVRRRVLVDPPPHTGPIPVARPDPSSTSGLPTEPAARVPVPAVEDLARPDPPRPAPAPPPAPDRPGPGHPRPSPRPPTPGPGHPHPHGDPFPIPNGRPATGGPRPGPGETGPPPSGPQPGRPHPFPTTPVRPPPVGPTPLEPTATVEPTAPLRRLTPEEIGPTPPPTPAGQTVPPSPRPRRADGSTPEATAPPPTR
jgi:Family of unknown function (DUF6049)